jgi:hypothetical protein
VVNKSQKHVCRVSLASYLLVHFYAASRWDIVQYAYGVERMSGSQRQSREPDSTKPEPGRVMSRDAFGSVGLRLDGVTMRFELKR